MVEDSGNLLKAILEIEDVDAVQQLFETFFLLGQMRHLLEEPRRDMVASGFAGALTALKFGVFSDHVLPVIVLPGDKLLPVANDLFGSQPAVVCQRNECNVHMRRLFIHVDDGRDETVFPLALLEKVKRMFKEGADFPFRLALKEFRTSCNQCLNKANAVFARPAACGCDLSFCFCTVFLFRGNQMEVERAAIYINVRIAGIFLFGTFIVVLLIFAPAFCHSIYKFTLRLLFAILSHY